MILAVLAAVGGFAAGQPTPAQRPETPQQIAAKHYDRGDALYKQGRFAEAIEAFAKAHQIAPHAMSLFSIARCYENLGNTKKALASYQAALSLSSEGPRRADIRLRIERLKSRPGKAFVSSRPSGAAVTADGRAKPEPKTTPTVVTLTPGEHLLVLRRNGYQIAVRRLVVEAGKELTVEIPLAPMPKSPMAKKPLTDWPGLRWHITGMASFGLVAERPTLVGPAIRGHASYKNFLFGAAVRGMSIPAQSLPAAYKYSDKDVLAKKITLGWITAQLEGGYRIPFDTVYLYGTVGLGIGYERLVFSGTNSDETSKASVTEHAVGFSWSVGLGVGAMATRWISIGAEWRFGYFRGRHLPLDQPEALDEVRGVPYTLLSACATFHP